MVAGSVLLGFPGDEFVCTHDHTCGDECLSFHLEPEVADTVTGEDKVWKRGALPPLPQIMVLGELAQAAASGDSDVGLDEVGMLIAMPLRLAKLAGTDRNICVANRLAIAVAQSKPRCGSMRTHTSRWTSRALRDKQASVRFTSCGCSPGSSA